MWMIEVQRFQFPIHSIRRNHTAPQGFSMHGFPIPAWSKWGDQLSEWMCQVARSHTWKPLYLDCKLGKVLFYSDNSYVIIILYKDEKSVKTSWEDKNSLPSTSLREEKKIVTLVWKESVNEVTFVQIRLNVFGPGYLLASRKIGVQRIACS